MVEPTRLTGSAICWSSRALMVVRAFPASRQSPTPDKNVFMETRASLSNLGNAANRLGAAPLSPE